MYLDTFISDNIEEIFVSHLNSLSFVCIRSAESLEPTYQQLQKMKLDKSPFVVVSVIGQELLTASHHGASVVVLEAALKIGTCSLKLRGSVFSALSSAYWSLGNTEKSTAYMQQDLEVAKTLGERLFWVKTLKRVLWHISGFLQHDFVFIDHIPSVLFMYYCRIY